MTDNLKWSRRLMRPPGANPDLSTNFVAKAWHIQSSIGSGTYCGVNVTRFYSDRATAPIEAPPEGEVCAKCLRQYARGVVLPQGGGASWRKG